MTVEGIETKRRRPGKRAGRLSLVDADPATRLRAAAWSWLAGRTGWKAAGDEVQPPSPAGSKRRGRAGLSLVDVDPATRLRASAWSWLARRAGRKAAGDEVQPPSPAGSKRRGRAALSVVPEPEDGAARLRRAAWTWLAPAEARARSSAPSGEARAEGSEGEGEASATSGATATMGRVARAHLKGLVEALVFASDRPMPLKEIARAAKADRAAIKELLGEIAAEFHDRGFRLEEVAGGWAFRTNAAYAPFVREVAAKKPVRMTRAQMEALAIVAYRQPITRPEIDEVRGVDSGPVLKSLLERDLVRILGKRDEPGRPMIYGTTQQFLEFFGLRSLSDLPTLREFTELTDESRRMYEREMGEEPPAVAAAGSGEDGLMGGEGAFVHVIEGSQATAGASGGSDATEGTGREPPIEVGSRGAADAADASDEGLREPGEGEGDREAESEGWARPQGGDDPLGDSGELDALDEWARGSRAEADEEGVEAETSEGQAARDDERGDEDDSGEDDEEDERDEDDEDDEDEEDDDEEDDDEEDDDEEDDDEEDE